MELRIGRKLHSRHVGKSEDLVSRSRGPLSPTEGCLRLGWPGPWDPSKLKLENSEQWAPFSISSFLGLAGPQEEPPLIPW